MVRHHNFAVPLRFLALVGHFFAALIALNALVRRPVRDAPSRPACSPSSALPPAA